MGSLKDQLLKAGLVSKKDARRVEHERRVEATRTGVGSTERAERAAQAQRDKLEAAQGEQRARDHAIEAERHRERDGAEAVYRLRDRIAAAALPRQRGERRWYFACQDELLRWLPVSDKCARKLEDGELAIVEQPKPDRTFAAYVVVPRDTARDLAGDPATSPLVRFWNRA
jgi:uncharacterized protein YaiL (DUF2058 family)